MIVSAIAASGLVVDAAAIVYTPTPIVVVVLLLVLAVSRLRPGVAALVWRLARVP